MRRLNDAAQLASVVLTVLLLSGCHTTRRGPIAPQPLPPTLEVQTDGETVQIHNPRVEGDVLVGWSRDAAGDSTEVRVPYVQERRELDFVRTAILVAAIGAVGVFTLGLIATRNVY